MANETPITIVGNMTRPPELRFTPSGAAVCNLSVAVTPRHFDKQSNEWVDDTTAFWDVTVWREQAENVAETFPDKGARVVVTGRIKTETWEDKQSGQPRSKQIIEADEIGPSLRYAVAQVRKAGGNQGGQQGGGFGGQQGGQGRPQGRPQQGQGRPPQGGQRGGRNQYAAAAGADTWQGGQQGGNYDWGADDSEPPF